MKRMRLTLLCFQIALLSACTHVMEIPKGVGRSYIGAQRQPIKVALAIDETFRNFDWNYQPCSACDTFVFPLGAHLVSSSETIARAVYANVVTVNGGSRIPEDVQLVLKPSVVKVDSAMTMWSWNQSVMTIIVEWKLMTPDGQPRWVKAVKGSGQNENGTAFSWKEQWTGRAKLMLDDVFHSAYGELVQVDYSSVIKNSHKTAP